MNVTELILRETNVSDYELFLNWETNPAVTKYFSISKGRTCSEIQKEIDERRNNDDSFDFTVVNKETNKPIGRVYISRYTPKDSSLDITRIYIGDIKDRGKGYGEKALRLVLDFAFKELKVHRVTLDHFSGNIIAANLYKKIGFKYEGIAREAVFKDGSYFDLHLMSILKKEY